MKQLGTDERLALLRVTMGFIVFAAGLTKAFGGVYPHAEALALAGFPVALGFAWSIAIFEIIAGILLMLGLFVRPVAWLTALLMASTYALIFSGRATASALITADPERLFLSAVLLVFALAVFFALQGPGKHSLDARLKN